MKTISSALRTHLDGTVTTLATIWRITRTDGNEFYFTDHDVDIVFDDGDGSATYTAETGYNRTAVSNNVGLAVDNMDVAGIFDDDKIKEDELRAGLFDYAEIRVSVVNWADLSQGALKVRRGRLGEVVITPQGVFRVELRGLTQLLSQNIVQTYQPECRVDLGSAACGIPIRPSVLARSTAVTVGQFYRVATKTTTGVTYGNLLTNPGFEQDTAPDTTPVGWTVAAGGWSVETIVGGLSPDEGTNLLGGGANASGELVQTIDLTTTNVSLTEIDAGNVIADFSVRRANADADDTGRVLVTFLDALNAPTGTMYDSTTETISPLDTWTTRSAAAVAVPANTRQIRVQLFHTRVTGGTSEAVFDNCSLTVTETNTLTTFQDLYENRVYEVTTAGTTDGSQPVYDTTVGNTTTDGTAVLTARDSFTRHADVTDAVDRDTLSVSVSEARAVDDWFNGGALVFETGANSGKVLEISDWVQSSGEIQLFLAAPFAIVPGTKARLYPGCDKRVETCSTKFNNVLNFRGEPYVPGQDELTRGPTT